MAATADALRAVNSILQYQQQRESSKVQESLALMQFGIQKRTADMKQAETQLAAAEKGNQQLQLQVAKEWIPASGLEGVYASVPDSKGLDSEEIEGNLDDLVGMLKSKNYGKFSETEATNIASAMWTFKNTQDPTSILSLATRFDSASSSLMGDTATDDEVAFLDSFKKIKTDADLLGLSESASKSLKNQYYITQEWLEFGQGDFDIQSPIGVVGSGVQQEFEQQQEMNVVDMADSMEDDLIPDDEIKGEKILDKTPRSNKQILDSIDYLSGDEKLRTKEELDKLTNEMKLVENKISELIDTRDEKLDLWDSLKVEKEELEVRRDYFNKIGETNKAEEIWNRMIAIANEQARSPMKHEVDSKEKFDSNPNRTSTRGGGYWAELIMNDDDEKWNHLNRNAPHLNTSTEKIESLKDRLRQLEHERNSYSTKSFPDFFENR